MTAQAEVPRRDAIAYLLAITAAGVGGFGLYPVVRFLLPSVDSGITTSPVPVVEVGDLKPGEYVMFNFQSRPAILILKSGGDPNNPADYVSFSAVCTHLGCTVAYRDDLKQMWCACHNGRYDLVGRVASGPPPVPLQRFDVFIRRQRILVAQRDN